MYSLYLGNSTERVSQLMVPGLPPLVIPVTKGGYLDGFICHAKSLRQMYLTKNYEDCYSVALAISYENLGQRQQLSQYPVGGLAALRLMKSWARVQIVARPNSSKMTVYFVDTGVVQDVDINNLYELPARLRGTPPLAIPISMDNGEPEVDFMELLKLMGAKVAVKLDKMRPHREAFQVSEFTVFERSTHNNLEVIEALKNPEFLARVGGSHHQLEPEFKAGAVAATTAALVTTTAAAAKSEINWAVFTIALICVLAFITVICVAVLYLVRKVKNKRRAEQQQQQAQEGTVNPISTVGESERNPDNTVHKEGTTVLPLQADGLAVVTATIALANCEKDKESARREERPAEQSQRVEEPSTYPEELSSYRVAIVPHDTRRAAGLSDISSIHSDDSFPLPRCSTPIFTSIFTPLRSVSARPSPPLEQRLPEAVPYREASEVSDYSDILDVRQYIPRNSLDQTVRQPSSATHSHVQEQPADETMYVTAPSSQGESQDEYS